MNIKTAIAGATRQLERSGIATARLDANVLLGHITGMTREGLLANSDNHLSGNDIKLFHDALERRSRHEPVAYITGKKEFWSLDFYVTRDTLIPRPDSETLVEAALKRARQFTEKAQAKPIALLDIGTGTGCLLIALLTELPSASGAGVDKCKRALQVAKENAKRHKVDDRAQFIHSHWCNALDRTFDLILSNPPYIASHAMSALMPDVACYEPHTALEAGADGLDAYRALAPQMSRVLNPGGYVVLEVGQGQADEVSQLLAAQGLKIEAVEKDLSGIERCVVARQISIL